jgi:DNA-binding protein H-NS
MKTYSDIRAEIAKLEKQAEAIRQTEIAGVISRIKVAIEAYGITAADLGFGRGAAKAVSPPKKKIEKQAKATTGIGIPKYRDPKTGKTWTGRGKPPTWIVGVKSRDAYLIDRQTEDASDATPIRSTDGTGKARVAAKAAEKQTSSPSKKGTRASRSAQPATVTTPAVQIESGVASE